MTTHENVIRIIPTEARFAEQMEALTDIVYGIPPGGDPGECLRAEHFRHHVSIFPEGQFVAVIDSPEGEQVVGLTASMRIVFDPDHPFVEPWAVTISGGWLRRHTPDADWMYGVESCVHPDFRGSGVGSRLMDARFAVAKALNVKGMVAGGTLMDYCLQADHATPEEYLQGVIEGRYTDGNVTKQIRKGFQPVALIPNYVTDPCSLGWGAVIVWRNPQYDPSQPVRLHLPESFRPPVGAFPLKKRA